MITDDETGVSEALASRLRSHGATPVVLRHGCASRPGEPPRAFVDLAEGEDVRRALGMLRSGSGEIGGVIHLAPLKCAGDGPPGEMTEWRERIRSDLRGLYGLARETAQDLQRRGRNGGATFLTATGMGGRFGISGPPSTAVTHGGIAAAMRTLAAEWPEVSCKVVDIDPSEEPSVSADRIWQELVEPDDLVQIGYDAGRRVTVRLEVLRDAANPGESDSRRTPDSNWVFLLTGGARGITAEITLMLAERYRPTLVLAGLSAAPAEEEDAATAGRTTPAELKSAIAALLRQKTHRAVGPKEVEHEYKKCLRERQIRRNLARMRSAGARVEYHSLDVRDETALTELVDGVYRRHGRLDGVVHGAGVIEDKLIVDKTADSFDRVVSTKLDSAFALSRLLRPESLEVFVLMSSVTAVFGNPGQFDYAAANGVLNSLATALSLQWPGRVVAIDWGPWDDTGMVSDEVREQFLRRGVRPIPVASGLAAFRAEIERRGGPCPVVVVGEGPWQGTTPRRTQGDAGALREVPA